MQRRFHDGIHHARIEFPARCVEHFRLRHSLFQRFRGTIYFGPPRLERIGNSQQDAFESRPAHRVFRREIGAAEKWLAVGRQERSQRPAALPGNRADRRLIARIHVRPLVAIHLHGHIKFVDHRRDLGIFVALAVNHVAPVAPHRANIQQNWFAFRPRVRKSFLAPFMPIHRLMRGRTQIRAGGILQAISSGVSHSSLSTLSSDSTLSHAPRWYTYLEFSAMGQFRRARLLGT